MYPDPIRLLTASDLPFAQQLGRIALWNQTEADWRRLLELSPEGCFLISADGHPAGTATTTLYSDQLAWIGMILVHPAFRRRGLATRLMQHCLSRLRDGLGLPCVKLDATPEGQPLYRRLGFQVDAQLHRWVAAGPIAGSPLKTLRPIGQSSEGGWDAAWVLDTQVFGVDRTALLRRLTAESHRGLQYGCRGYGLLRHGALASYLGPVVAADDETGKQLVMELLSDLRGDKSPGDGQPVDAVSDNREGLGNAVYWDIPQANRAAEQWAQQLGFVRQRPLIRMWTGQRNCPSELARQWAITGPETG